MQWSAARQAEQLCSPGGCTSHAWPDREGPPVITPSGKQSRGCQRKTSNDDFTPIPASAQVPDLSAAQARALFSAGWRDGAALALAERADVAKALVVTLPGSMKRGGGKRSADGKVKGGEVRAAGFGGGNAEPPLCVAQSSTGNTVWGEYFPTDGVGVAFRGVCSVTGMLARRCAEQLHIISVAECLWPNGQYSTATMHMLSSSLQSRVTSQPPCCCQAGGLTGSKTTNIMLHRLAAKVVEAARQHIAAEAARKALEARVEAETVAAAAVNGVCTLVAVHSCAHLAQVGLGSGPRSSVSVSDWSLDSCA